jgi:hypothetical protein
MISAMVSFADAINHTYGGSLTRDSEDTKRGREDPQHSQLSNNARKLASESLTGLSCRPSLKRFDEPTNVRLHLILFRLERYHFFRELSNRWQAVARRMRAAEILVFRERTDEVIQVPSTEDDRLVEAFVASR